MYYQYCTDLPFFYKLGEYPKEVGGVSLLGALVKHEAHLSVSIFHLGIGLQYKVDLPFGKVEIAVSTQLRIIILNMPPIIAQ